VPSDRAGADPGPTPHEPPDRGDSARSDLVILSGATGSSGRPRSAAIGPLDPRRPPETLTDRDVTALAFIGRSQEARSTAPRSGLPGLSEAVVSRRSGSSLRASSPSSGGTGGITAVSARPPRCRREKGARDDELFLRAPLAQSAVAHHLWSIAVSSSTGSAPPTWPNRPGSRAPVEPGPAAVERPASGGPRVRAPDISWPSKSTSGRRRSGGRSYRGSSPSLRRSSPSPERLRPSSPS
jgi:hypothetical protein